MILLYVDESGNLEDPKQHFVLGAVALHERDIAPAGRRIAGIVSSFAGDGADGLEFHAQHIRTGKGPWRGVAREAREGALDTAANYLGKKRRANGYSLFSVVRAPEAQCAGRWPSFETCFEELLGRFTQSLIRRESEDGHQMGLVVADEAKYEKTTQPLAEAWRSKGGRIGRLTRLAEVPLFADSKSSRLIQGADFVAHAVYRHYEFGDSRWMGSLLPAFDNANGVLHGLCHLVAGYRTCPCPACVSRASVQAGSPKAATGARRRRRLSE